MKAVGDRRRDVARPGVWRTWAWTRLYSPGLPRMRCDQDPCDGENAPEPTIDRFFRGDGLEALTRYAGVLGGEAVGVFRNADVPHPKSLMRAGDDPVTNMSLRLGSATILASDAPPSREAFDRIHAPLTPESVEADAFAPCEIFRASVSPCSPTSRYALDAQLRGQQGSGLKGWPGDRGAWIPRAGKGRCAGGSPTRIAPACCVCETRIRVTPSSRGRWFPGAARW